MARRVPVQTLRGSDSTLLEVQLSDILRRPLGQVAPVNMMDLIELAGTEGRPQSLEKQLQGFVDAVGRQVSDIPNGGSWIEFLEEMESLDGSRVPHRFRAFLKGQLERDERESDRVARLLETWAGQEPEPFPLGDRVARVQRAEAVKPRAPSAEPSSAPREGKRKASSSTSGSSRGGASRARAPKAVLDIDRLEFLEELCMERLGRATSNGLGEHVLVAGVRHHSKERYPHVTPRDVLDALNSLKGKGLVRYSARRWASAQSW